MKTEMEMETKKEIDQVESQIVDDMKTEMKRPEGAGSQTSHGMHVNLPGM